MGIYLDNGFLNFEHVYNKGAWLNIIIGKRQAGKTYNTLRGMLEHDLRHILLRRTTAELDTISAAPDLNPYKAFEPDYKTGLFKQAKKLCRISDYETDEQGRVTETTPRGIATSLAEIAHIRGFDGSSFSDLVFDEFIPEKGIVTRTTEGDSFLNAYVTINGNRELKGRPPLRAWLLANSNRIDSPILEALNLTDDILYMRKKGLEELKTETGAYILQPSSDTITAARSETALMRQINSKSDFYKMAMENEFAYDDSPYIKQISLKGFKPLFCFDDLITAWRNDAGTVYICRAPFTRGMRRYENSRSGRELLQNDWLQLRPYYYAGRVLFSDLRAQALFKSLLL